MIFSVCGSSSNLEAPTARIVGGKEASSSQWPSLSLLYNKQQNTYCTATVVTPLWALASYSCVLANNIKSSNRSWRLLAGGHNKSDNRSTQIRDVEEIVPHPQVRKFVSFLLIFSVHMLRIHFKRCPAVHITKLFLLQKSNFW